MDTADGLVTRTPVTCNHQQEGDLYKFAQIQVCGLRNRWIVNEDSANARYYKGNGCLRRRSVFSRDRRCATTIDTPALSSLVDYGCAIPAVCVPQSGAILERRHWPLLGSRTCWVGGHIRWPVQPAPASGIALDAGRALTV
jgi:hypothetical protein